MIATQLVLPKISYFSLLPEISLIAGALVMLAMTSVVRNKITSDVWAGITIMASIASIGFSIKDYHDVLKFGPHLAIDNVLAIDGFSVLTSILVAVCVIIGAFLTQSFVDREKWSGPEVFALILLSASGADFMGSANDLIMVFLGLEIMSISLYVLAALDTKRVQSGEAALKYLVLGGFASAIFIYGSAFVYGSTGSTNLGQIASFFATSYLTHSGLLIVGFVLVIAGLGFKVAAAPFHVWSPDVYQGAPSPSVTFMSAIAKIGGFAALIRILMTALISYKTDWQPIIYVLAVASLLIGAFGGLVQTNVKRMLAYSAINHSGFILLGLVAATTSGISGSFVYLIAYSLIVTGVFSVVTVLGLKGDNRHDIKSYRGLSKSHPYLILGFAILLLGQAGIPGTVGFIAKLSVLEALAKSGGEGAYALVTVALVSSVVSAVYYLRVIITCYSKPGEKTLFEEIGELPYLEDSNDSSSGDLLVKTESVKTETAVKEDSDNKEDDIKIGFGASVSILVTSVTVVVLGVFPNFIIDLANHAKFIF